MPAYSPAEAIRVASPLGASNEVRTVEARPLVLPFSVALTPSLEALIVLPCGLLATWKELEAEVVISESTEAATEPRATDVVEFFNRVESADEIVQTIKDDPAVHAERKGYGVRPSLARRILETRIRLGRFSSFDQIDAIRGVGVDTAHDIRQSVARLATLGAVDSAKLTPRAILRSRATVVAAIPFRADRTVKAAGLEFATLAWRITVGAMRGEPSSAFVTLAWRDLRAGQAQWLGSGQ
ncbi:MAG: hypothetical protein AAGF12_22145 [Myxococcota bacterium]